MNWDRVADCEEKTKLMSLPIFEVGKSRLLFKLERGYQFQEIDTDIWIFLLNVFIGGREYLIPVSHALMGQMANFIRAGYSDKGEYIISKVNERNYSLEPAESQVAPERREREERVAEKGNLDELDVVLSHFSKKQQIKLMSEYIKTEMSNCGDVFEDFMNIVEHEYPDKISEIDDALEDLYETC